MNLSRMACAVCQDETLHSYGVCVGCKTNNNPPIKHPLSIWNQVAKRHAPILTVEQRAEIRRQFYDEKKSYQVLAKEHKISIQHVKRALGGH